MDVGCSRRHRVNHRQLTTKSTIRLLLDVNWVVSVDVCPQGAVDAGDCIINVFDGIDSAGVKPSGLAVVEGTSWKLAAVEVKSAMINIIANAICFISCQTLLLSLIHISEPTRLGMI